MRWVSPWLGSVAALLVFGALSPTAQAQSFRLPHIPAPGGRFAPAPAPPRTLPPLTILGDSRPSPWLRHDSPPPGLPPLTILGDSRPSPWLRHDSPPPGEPWQPVVIHGRYVPSAIYPNYYSPRGEGFMTSPNWGVVATPGLIVPLPPTPPPDDGSQLSNLGRRLRRW
jgi:hypothetical protein